jgi:hypothetical protein
LARKSPIQLTAFKEHVNKKSNWIIQYEYILDVSISSFI